MFGRRALLGFAPAACVLALALSPGCQKHGNKTGAEGSEQGGSQASAVERVPDLPGEGQSLGMQPAYMDGAMIYASVRAGLVQEQLQSIPLPPDGAEELAELGAVLGFDPRVDDGLAHLGVAPDARVSLSVRPVIDHAAAIRKALAARGPELEELAGRDLDPRSPSLPPDDSPPPEPPPLSAKAEALLAQARTVGFHLRVHVPTKSPAKLEPVIAAMREEFGEAAAERWATTCAGLGPTRLCAGENDGLLVVRDVPDGVGFDLYIAMIGDSEQPDSPGRRALIQAALGRPRGGIPAAAALRGDANLLVDAGPTVAMLRAGELASAVRRLPWSGVEVVDRQLERDGQLRELHESTAPAFRGAQFELDANEQRVLAVARWLPNERASVALDEVFALSKIDADVPSIAALCEGALICGRSRGLPQRARFHPLARGIYARPEALADALDDNDELAPLILALESWPNALGTLALLPGNVIEPPESFVFDSAATTVERVLGAGFSVRSLSEQNGDIQGDWVAYARMSSADLNGIAGYLGMAELRLSPASISGVEGRVESLKIPNGPGNYYAVHDPKGPSGAWGWAVIADGDDRVRWLAGREHDDGAAPLAYLEFGDLWRLVSGFEDGRDELRFAQAWLSKRWIRAQLSLGEAGPELRLAMGKLP